jgi:hypothetical protein
MANLDLYLKVAEVPQNAKKTIGAGRLKGMTDINPMWRIKALTEQFGICGIGWKYTITDKRIEEGADGVKCAFVDIDLFVKVSGEWSEAIPGTGGSTFVANERNGLYTSDECFKMALTDAISVACKALGFGANVYWEGGRTKYTAVPETHEPPKTSFGEVQFEQSARDRLVAKLKEKGIDAKQYATEHGLTKDTADEVYEALLKALN